MKYFKDIFNVFTRASRIRADEERRQKSFGFAVSSIICSVLAVVFAILCRVLMKNLAGDLGDFLQLLLFGILAFCAAALLIASLLRVIAQFTINRIILSWIALAILIAATVTSTSLIISAII